MAYVWVRRLKQLASRVVPGYQGAQSRAIGAEKRGYTERSRLYVKLVTSISALSLAILLATWWFAPAFDSQQSYIDQLHVALAKADYVGAKVPLDALLKDAPSNFEYRWCHASIEEQFDRVESANTVRTELAREGYGKAILWLADRDFRMDSMDAWTDEQHTSFRELLGDTSKCSIDTRIELNKRLAAYWTRQGELNSAIESLTQIAQWHPAANVNVAALYLQIGDLAQAQASAKQARLALQAHLDKNPTDIECRMQLVRALLMLDLESNALIRLAEGLELTKQPVMRQAAGEVLVHWARRLERTEGRKATFWPRLQLIHRSSLCAPKDAVVLNATLDLIDECQDDQEARIVELREATAKGVELVAAHTMLAWLHCVALHQENALRHATRVIQDSPELPTILNNLALAMLERRDYSQDQTLAMVDLALELLPEQPQFVDTRARILAQRQ